MEERLGTALDKCASRIDRKVAARENCIFDSDRHPGELWGNAINFNNLEINSESFKKIFSSFDKVYHETKGPEKLLIATLANELRNYWHAAPPNNLDRKEITQLYVDYPELFYVGNHAKKVISEVS